MSRRSCGCFDGHHVDGDEEPVAIRCDRHRAVPAEIRGAPVRRLYEARITRLVVAAPVRPARHMRVIPIRRRRR